MTIRISDKHDTMVLNMISGSRLTAAAKDTLLQNVKTELDAVAAGYKSANGEYTVPHVRQAASRVLARGK
jgi:hypothetical protein